MGFKNLKNVHIIGIGGCASSAIAELLTINKVQVTGSEMKKRADLSYLEKMGIIIKYTHDRKNIINLKPDIILYSPAVMALNPHNPEILEAKKKNIKLLSWQEFIGDYLNSIGRKGITVSGSEGKGTTAGVLTIILKGTKHDPLAILGAKIKGINNGASSNIYLGMGDTYILEGDEYNRNFYYYNPSVNITVNFKYEHPETYKNFGEYKEAFFNFFSKMKNEKLLIFKATENTVNLVNEFCLDRTHNIIWYGDNCNKDFIKKCSYIIDKISITKKGINYLLTSKERNIKVFIPAFPGYMVYNTTGAIIAAVELGVPDNIILENLKSFKGMIRRFDLYKIKKGGIIITDYGHSPEAVNIIINEARKIFKNKKIHLIFQPHLFTRTYNFFNEFVDELKKADKISLIDIYPAREDPVKWRDKISSYMIYEELKKAGATCFYEGKSSEMFNNMKDKIDEKEITIFIGAGDMDFYYNSILEYYNAKSFF